MIAVDYSPSPNLADNSSFETGPSVPPNSLVALGAGSTDLAGWTIASGSIDVVDTGYWAADDGNRSIELNAGAIEQTIATVPGDQYTVSFWHAADPTGSPHDTLLEVSAAQQSEDYSFNSAATTADPGWTEDTFTFTAIDSTTTLRFAGLTGGANSPTLDNVSVAQDVPTPLGTASILEMLDLTDNATVHHTGGTVSFSDADLTDRPTAALAGQSVTYLDSHGGVVPLSADQISLFEAAFSIMAPTTNLNNGTIGWNYSIADNAIDFLGAGESVTVASTIQVDDHHGGIASQQISITIDGTNDMPVPVADIASVTKDTTVTADAGHGLLANDTDPDIHDVLAVSAVGFGNTNDAITSGGSATIDGTYGALELNSDGSYSYTAGNSLPAQGLAQDVFSYSVSDGLGGIAQSTLTMTITNPSQQYIIGSPGGTTSGGNGQEVIDASLGHQSANGGNGADVLIGGPNDILTGGNGPDTFVFGPSFGQNTITDFDTHNDTIQFGHSLFASFADVAAHMQQIGTDTVITYDATDMVTLQHVAAASLHASDFILG
jgi:choice-of-anchor C domain-containing protein